MHVLHVCQRLPIWLLLGKHQHVFTHNFVGTELDWCNWMTLWMKGQNILYSLKMGRAGRLHKWTLKYWSTLNLVYIPVHSTKQRTISAIKKTIRPHFIEWLVRNSPPNESQYITMDYNWSFPTPHMKKNIQPRCPKFCQVSKGFLRNLAPSRQDVSSTTEWKPSAQPGSPACRPSDFFQDKFCQNHPLTINRFLFD